ncbi:MAG: pyridoxal-phosphate dependent enzyme, partial [Microthrixaceae bacterium]|nr:pyridoxal-phosphate dependent enzyme [Microthrixaceae bacterium]
GLISGIASTFAQLEPELGRRVRVIGVQAENAAAYPPSIAAGEPVSIATTATIADGIMVGRPGDLNFGIVRDAVDEIVTVSDDETAQALVVLLERAKLVVEPAGAVGVAAALAGRYAVDGPTVVVLSGGNIDPMLLERVISRGLIASERYLRLRIPLPDRPGQLARTAELVA